MQVLKRVFFTFLILCGLIGPPAFAAGNLDGTAIVINLPSRTLDYYETGKLIREYRVAIGSPYSPTPLGTFSIIDKEINPWWYPPGKDYSVPSGPANPLGYRWMGFLPTYGIHGTNMPWSISHVISNGCIRMHEEDVEELFSMVAYSTPVKITYERIRTQIDSQGNASIGVYPDVYGYKNISLASAQQALAANGLDGLADEAFLSKALSEEAEQQIIFAQVYNLVVNGVSLTGHAVALEGAFYVPAVSIASAIATKVTWDEEKQAVSRKQHSVPGMRKGQTVYISINDVTKLFGGKQSWQDFGRSLSITIPTLFFNGQSISSDVHTVSDQRLVPALPVAKALGLKLNYDDKRHILRNSIRQIPIEMIDDEPYIDTTKLGEYYNAGVSWNEDQQVLDLNHPAYLLDCSMYLDLMQDFLT